MFQIKGKLLTKIQLLSLMQIIAFTTTATLKKKCNSNLQLEKYVFHKIQFKTLQSYSANQFVAINNTNKIKQHTMNSSNKCETTKMDHRQLAIFDFDYTVVACNTDTVVRDLLPPDKLTKEVNDIIDTKGWTAYMAEIFRLLREQRCSKAKIMDTIRAIPEVPGFVRLLKRLHQNYNFDMIIISDSNSVFIDEWLQAHGLGDSFHSVFTNPAHFDETGMLNIQPYHAIGQTECKLSAPNLCKGRVMTKFVIEQDLKNRIQYDRVIYVGDGSNDICPVLRLRPCDFACARQGFSLEKLIAKTMEKNELQCDAIVWRNGFDLLEQLETKLQLKRAGGFY